MVMAMSDNIKSKAQAPLGFLAQWHEDVHCVFGRDPAAHSVWEILLTYSGVHAVLVHRISHRLWKANWKLAARILAAFSRMYYQCRNSSRRHYRQTTIYRSRAGRGDRRDG